MCWFCAVMDCFSFVSLLAGQTAFILLPSCWLRYIINTYKLLDSDWLLAALVWPLIGQPVYGSCLSNNLLIAQYAYVCYTVGQLHLNGFIF